MEKIDKEQIEKIDYLRSEINEELDNLIKLYRRKSNYKRYSKGMKSAFKNRAVGLEKAKIIIDDYLNLIPFEEPAELNF